MEPNNVNIPWASAYHDWNIQNNRRVEKEEEGKLKMFKYQKISFQDKPQGIYL